MQHAYLGPSFDDDAIEAALKTYKIRASRLSDPAATAAEMLSQGKILGWYQGRMEFGPRALGSRSILADPRDPEMNIKVNNAVKFREWWRPFAPSFKKEAAPDYLESAYDSPFMILTAQVRQEKRSVIPSVTHVDGSARPQTVDKEINPLYYRLIDEFGRRTGVPVVIEHIVQSAWRSYRSHAHRRDPHLFQFRHGRPAPRQLSRGEMRHAPAASLLSARRLVRLGYPSRRCACRSAEKATISVS